MELEFKYICDTIFRLYLYADVSKMIHYSTEKNHTHQLADDLREAIEEFVDELAEQLFGYYKKPKFSDFTSLSKLKVENIDNIPALCQTLMDLTSAIRSKVKNHEKMGNVVSLIDDFQGSLNKFKFLATFDKNANV